MSTTQFLLGTTAIAGGLYAGLTAVFTRFLPPAAKSGIPFGIGVCAATCLASYFLLVWAGRRADKTFFAAFAAGMLGRFVVLTAAIFVAFRIPSIDFHGALFALLGAFFPLMGFEVWAVVRRLDLFGASRGRGGPAPASTPAVAK